MASQCVCSCGGSVILDIEGDLPGEHELVLKCQDCGRLFCSPLPESQWEFGTMPEPNADLPTWALGDGAGRDDPDVQGNAR
jgi:hypothetical protein